MTPEANTRTGTDKHVYKTNTVKVVYVIIMCTRVFLWKVCRTVQEPKEHRHMGACAHGVVSCLTWS